VANAGRVRTAVDGDPGVTEPISFPARLDQLAAAEPQAPAIVFLPEVGPPSQLTRSELALGSRRLARLLQARGVAAGDTVIIALPNGPLHYLASYAVWRLGACALPLSTRMTEIEKQQIADVAAARAVIGDWGHPEGAIISQAELEHLDRWPATSLDDVIAHPGKAIASGGSTGRPKVIVDPNPWQGTPGGFVEHYRPLGLRTGQVQLVVGPLYHNAPFLVSHIGLFEEQPLVVLDRFDVGRVLDAIERYRVNWCYLSPTMMHRVIKAKGVRQRDWSSLEMLYHTSAPCPAWLKEAWIDLLGAERVVEAYGSTEAVGAAVIRGDEWLSHRGSVGRPFHSEVRVIGEDGNDLPCGQVGLLFFRAAGSGTTYRYLGGDPLPATDDGFAAVGDLGWVDDEGYVYLADRRADLIITGGVNVYPAEVEGVLLSHPAVTDAVVIGLPDDEWGKRVHATIQLDPAVPPVSAEALDRFIRTQLSAVKVPRT